MSEQDCIFCKIIAGQLEARIFYEDDDLVAFWDINPQAPKHFLVVPRRHLVNASELTPDDDVLVGKMLRIAAQLAEKQGIGDGYRFVLNNGEPAGQAVFHIHLHTMGGRRMTWPPG